MRNASTLLATLVISLVSSWSVPAAASFIVGVSSPVGSDDSQSHPSDDNVWSVTSPPYPLDVNTGIGYILNPVHPVPPTGAVQADFSRHDHVLSGANVPDPTRAVVTYQFNAPTIVDQLEIIQHSNGITRVEGFVGNSLGTLVSIGSIFGPSGDNTTFNGLVEGSSHVFDFDNTMAGTYFQFIVRKINAGNGWATYRAFPRLADGTRISTIPEPATALLLLPALVGIVVARRRMV